MTLESARSGAIDPDDPVLPEWIAHPSTETGEVVALLVEEDVRAAGWGVRVAIEFASEWSRADARVVLCDADLAGAPLHGAVGTENLEGVADLIHYGASPPRVTRRVEDRDFLFITSGTVIADSPAVYRHSRWSTLLDAYRESGTVLLLYLPAEASGVEELAGRADRVIRLATVRPERELGPGEVVLHGGRPGAGEPEAVPEGPDEGEKPPRGEILSTVGSGIEVVTEDDDDRGSARTDAEPESDGVEPEPSMASPSGEYESRESDASLNETSALAGPASARRGEPRRTTPWLMLLLLVVVGAVLVSAWFGWVPIPGLTPASSTG